MIASMPTDTFSNTSDSPKSLVFNICYLAFFEEALADRCRMSLSEDKSKIKMKNVKLH